MAASKTPKPAVARFDDHEVITPPHKLGRVVARGAAEDDPVARAEAALAQLSSQFTDWMNDECEQLDKARNHVRQAGMAVQQREALFRVAHDIKGQAVTLGFPLVADVAGGLCRLIEETRDPRRIPLALVDQHVDAVRAIMREQGRPGAEAIARELTQRLREVSRFFLRRGDNDPDGIESGPPIVPEK
jgi:chemotaxis protein histidine kinase CheA